MGSDFCECEVDNLFCKSAEEYLSMQQKDPVF